MVSVQDRKLFRKEGKAGEVPRFKCSNVLIQVQCLVPLDFLDFLVVGVQCTDPI